MATTNGPVDASGSGDAGKFIDNVDPDDPDYIKSLQKPPNIREDMHEMERRKRVSQIMNSQAFRRELEDIIDIQLQYEHNPNSAEMMQEISNFLFSKPQSSAGLPGFAKGSVGVTAPIIPIADIRGTDAAKYSKLEKILRCKLASLYRLVDLLGWSQGIYNHITVRLSQDMEHFLINPFGLMYGEVTASSLIKINLTGDVVDQGSTTLGINEAGFTLHSAIHAARPDIKCVIHLHNQAVVAVSSMQCGLLYLCQEACIVGEVSYHDYQGIILTQEEKDVIMRKFSEGSRRKVMVLRNHGVVACGESVEEAFHFAVNLVKACEMQIHALAASKKVDELIHVSDDIRDRVYVQASKGGGGVDSTQDKRKWKVGQLEFEAYMRMLDNAGYRTGYMYSMPHLKSDKVRAISEDDVMYPPASQSSAYEDEFGSPHKHYMNAMKKHDKKVWLNTPNVYSKVEIKETGTQDPKTITTWVKDSNSPSHSTPMKVDSSKQFAPTNTDIREFKALQSKLKNERRADKISAGPQSKLLEGVSWDEAQKMQDSNLSGTQDQLIVIGAASKGIVERGHQYNAQVYRSYYANNPFGNVTDEELEAYKREIERKQKGLPPEDEEMAARAEAALAAAAAAEKGAASPTSDVADGYSSDSGSPVTPTRTQSNRVKGRQDRNYFRRAQSEGKGHRKRETAINGENDERRGTVRSNESGDMSRSSKEGSPTKEHPDDSFGKDKKKKKGFRTPSFLKSKDKKKKSKDEGVPQHAETPPKSKEAEV